MANGFAVRIRAKERRDVSAGIFGFLKAATEMNMTLADLNKKAPSVRDEAKGTTAQTKEVVEATR